MKEKSDQKRVKEARKANYTCVLLLCYEITMDHLYIDVDDFYHTLPPRR